MNHKQLSLAALRVNKNMTQQDAADILGISREQVGKVESGKDVKPVYIYAFAQLYGVETDIVRIEGE